MKLFVMLILPVHRETSYFFIMQDLSQDLKNWLPRIGHTLKFQASHFSN